MGSTFAVELPIYCRHTSRNEATEMDSVVSMPPVVQPRPRIRATNIVRVVPVNTFDEMVGYPGHADIERGGAQKLTILVVDDSSPNRYNSAGRSSCSSGYGIMVLVAALG